MARDGPIVGGGKYRINERIGGGSFGEVHKGTELETKQKVAVKLEPVTCKVPQLVYEARVLQYLQRHKVIVGIPELRWYGTEGDFNIMVFELLGPSLEKLRRHTETKKLPFETVALLAVQLICRLEFLHNRSFIHRDIKPDNFVMGTGKKSHHVYMIDFGLAKRYRDPTTLQHIPMREGKSLTGTARYTSVNTHMGMEQSRRDDLESLGYVLVYLANGNLPWSGKSKQQKSGAARTGNAASGLKSGPRGDRQEVYDQIAENKAAISPEGLCKLLPPCMAQYFAYTRKLGFTEDPDYELCRKFFQDYLESECCGLVWSRLDWVARRDGSDIASVSSVGAGTSQNVTVGEGSAVSQCDL